MVCVILNMLHFVSVVRALRCFCQYDEEKESPQVSADVLFFFLIV